MLEVITLTPSFLIGSSLLSANKLVDTNRRDNENNIVKILCEFISSCFCYKPKMTHTYIAEKQLLISGNKIEMNT